MLTSAIPQIPDVNQLHGASGEAGDVVPPVPMFAVESKLYAYGFDTQGDQAGSSVAAEGDYLVVGAPYASHDGNPGGAAYVYLRDSVGTLGDVSDDTWDLTEILAGAEPDGGFGHSVSISGHTIVVGANTGDGNAGSAYVFARNESGWSQQQILIAEDAEHDDYFGGSVSIDGDTIVVGAYGDDDGGSRSGAAYVFTRNEGVWTEQQKLIAADARDNDYLGWSVSISGDTAVVGAYGDDEYTGSAYVFTRNESGWSQWQKLVANDAASWGHFGQSAAISEDTIVVGSHGDDYYAGAAYVFTRSQSGWNEQQKLTANDAESGDCFGHSLMVDGDTIVVGAPWDDDGGWSSGSAYVFTRSVKHWSQQEKLHNAALTDHANFGKSVAVSGDTIVVGAYGNGSGGPFSGAAYGYGRNGAAWTQSTTDLSIAPEFGPFGVPEDRFGTSVAVDGDYVVIGAPHRGRDFLYGAGAAFVYLRQRNGTPDDRSDDTWQYQATLTAQDADSGDWFGSSVSIDGGTIVVGAYTSDGGGAASGSVYVFTSIAGTWSQQQKLTASDAAAGASFGRSVSIDGNTIVVGATGTDGGGPHSGAAYVFSRSGDTWIERQKLTAADAASGDVFGREVAIDGDTIIVTATGNDEIASNSGAAYVFGLEDATWSQRHKLTASDAANGDYFGYSVSISGDTVIVGAVLADGHPGDAGAAYVFARNGDTWSQQQKLTRADPAHQQRFGGSVSVSGEIAVIGSLTGSAHVFVRRGAEWNQYQELELDEPNAVDCFGCEVAVSGDTVAIGAPRDSDGGHDSGASYVFGPAVDFGDAPDAASGTGPGNYNSLLTDDGPRHMIVPGLMMGSGVDGERDAWQGANVDGDDVDDLSGDDEDGIANPSTALALQVDNVPLVSVTVTNTTGNVASLYGWIDYNGDGVFDNGSERASVAVPDGVEDGVATLVFPAVPDRASRDTVARFRLSTDSRVSQPTGVVEDGEVEDYPVTIYDSTPWRNPALHEDVNDDGHVTSLDVLLLIVDINRGGIRTLPSVHQSDETPAPFLDVTGDNSLAPMDVLSVIACLNSIERASEGEGEAAAPFLPGIPPRIGRSAPIVSPSISMPALLPHLPTLERDRVPLPTTAIDQFYAAYGRSLGQSRQTARSASHSETLADMALNDGPYADADASRGLLPDLLETDALN